MQADAITRFKVGNREFRFYLPDPDDHIQRIIRETSAFYELEMLADMLLLITEGDLIVDCGANIGNHSIFLAGAAEATVIALEPFRHCFDILDRNIALNDLDGRVLPMPLACGAKCGTGRIIPGEPANLGQTRVSTAAKDRGVEVEIIPLDDLKLPAPVRMLKIDVEGMEAEVLRGASRILKEDGPIIYAEAFNDNALAEISMVIRPFGYNPTFRFNATPTYRFEKK